MQRQKEKFNLDDLTGLIRIIRDRQQLYFSLLSFIMKNIESSSNKLDQIGLFNRFLNELKSQEKRLFKTFVINEQEVNEQFYVQKNDRQIGRLSSRLVQMFQSSLQKSSNSIFNSSGNLSIQFFRFKKLLHRITSSEQINIKNYITTFLNYALNKYNRQVFRIEKYLIKLQSGEPIQLKDMFCKNGSDASCPQDQSKQIKKSLQKIKQSHHLQKKSFTKSKMTKKSSKPRISLAKRKSSEHLIEKQEKQKVKTATKLYKFYQFLQLNKKQFMEDYVFEEQQKQVQKQKLLNSLLQKNKAIKQQINNYVDKSQSNIKPIRDFETIKSKGESMIQGCVMHIKGDKKSPLRKSFIISKRKSSLTIQNGSQNSQCQKQVAQFTKTQGHPRQVISKSSTKPTRTYIIKALKLFEQQIIPDSQILKKDLIANVKSKQRRNQYVRMRKRNHPTPIERNKDVDNFTYDRHRL